MPSLLIGRRYQIINALGTGGMGIVYRAFDRLTGQVVALKRVTTTTTEHATPIAEHDMRVLLAQEFKMLASLRHPHIIGVLDYGFHDKQPYYTMELLENASTIIEAGQNQPLVMQVNLVVQLLQALVYLHRRGILHRDLKPSNVLVVNGQVKVLDFGLAMTREQMRAEAQRTAGTLAYMAPEVLLQGEITEAADLYSVGMIAYELFAGRHPFDDESTSTLIDNILYKYLDIALIEVNEQIAWVLDRLLAKEPRSRYTDASQVIAALSKGTNQPLPQETTATRESFLQAAQLVGREAEIRTLSQAFDEATRGQGSAWLIGGESGVGKSRLLDEMRVLALVQGAAVLRGQTVSEGGVPYQLWRSALRWLALTTELSDRDASILSPIIPDIGFLLNREVPEPSASDHLKLIDVAEAMFRNQTQPMVIILEDLQWAGSDSRAVLSRLVSIAAEMPLLIIGSYRSDETLDMPDMLPGMALMRLERLNLEGIAQLSAAMLGPTGRQWQIVDLLQRETEGNVFFVVEVVRALAEEAGQLDQIGTTTLPQQVFAGGMRRIVQRRLSRVPAADRPLLALVAVAGRELDLELLTRLAGQTNLEQWLVNCANAAVLTVSDGEWRFAHDKLRDGVLVDLSEAGRSDLHCQVAQALESVYPDQPEHAAMLAYHWNKAGNMDKEIVYATTAGEYALRIGTYEEALAFLNRALSLTLQSSSQEADSEAMHRRQVQLKSHIAQAHLGMGHYAEARRYYNENVNTCREIGDQTALADSYANLGDIDYALEDFELAQQHYEQSLDIYQVLNDQRGVARVLNNLGNVAYDLGNDNKARQLYQESLAINRGIGNQWGMAGSVRNQASQDDDPN